MAQANDKTADFLDIFFRHAELMYPRLKETFRYNSAAKKSEPCALTAANAAWSCGMKMPKAQAKEFFQSMKAHYEACRARNSKLPEFSKVFGLKRDDETGTVTFEARKRGVSAAGTPNKAPTVIDSNKMAITGEALDIWSGSTGTVRVRAFPTVDPDGVGGISLLLDTVQIIKPRYGSANLDGFEVEEVTAEDVDAAAERAFAGAAGRKAASNDEF
jgi:hypothetical protein